MLEVKGITTFYGNIKATNNVCLTVNQGEIVTIIGSNGAGKTTTLKTISGLLNPSEGEIYFNNVKISGLSAENIVKLGLIHAPEGRRLFPGLTVYGNLEIGAYSVRKSKKEFNKNLEKVYEFFPVLKERKNQLCWSLSGGEQQMAAIGRGLMANPKLLILDEPSLGLAPIVVETVFKAIKEINNSGTTILLVEQNAYGALSIADRAYVMEVGKITLQGLAKDLLNNDQVKKAYLGI
ncbi:ABC transporter ATP-binding protein [Desulfitobacterium sp. AusDCA]|uniref:ABC transporter ATP-binding protein n=1 Tax=Desulfitobacterium sp. AusDCA TaxID=3240383 RepID=UPI003DA78E09